MIGILLRSSMLLLFWAGTAAAQSPGSFTATGKMITPRSAHTTTLLLDGRVLIAGGNSSYSVSDAESSIELYDPVSETFLSTGSMTTPRDSLLASERQSVNRHGDGPRATCCSDAV